MELLLEVPAEWQRRVVPERIVALVPGVAAAPDVILAWAGSSICLTSSAP